MKRVGLLLVGVFVVGAMPILAQEAGDAANGQKVYAAQRCSVCHKVGEAGGAMGPALTTVGDKRDMAWLKKYLVDPKSVSPDNRMPAVKVEGKELDDLVAYLLTLKAKQ
jgi:putative heme-binding domain-containing protein